MDGKLVFINSSNFPYGLASIEKIRLIGKGLGQCGYSVYVFNMYSNLDRDKYPDFKPVGKIDNIKYIYTSGKAFRMSKLLKLYNIPLAMIREIFIFRKIFKGFDNRKVILHYTSFLFVVWYYLMSKIFRFKLFIHNMEYHISIKKTLNSILFDKYSYRFSDGAIVISSFLKDIVLKYNPGKKVFILPVSVDFSLFQSQNQIVKDYLLFCASAGHFRVFKFVIDAFEEINNNSLRLSLICNGKEYEINRVKEYISKNTTKSQNIDFYSDLKYSDLVKMYSEAKLLLIPLFDNERDKARFPHKIGEYTASKRPFLTHNIGEIPFYFKDGENAYIVEGPLPVDFAKKITQIITEEGKLTEVGYSGYLTGVKNFNFENQTKTLAEFIK